MAWTSSVGIGVDIVNGAGSALVLSPTQRTFHINSLRLQVTQLDYPAPDVMDWLQAHSDMSVLDWSGISHARTMWGGGPGDYEETRGLLGAAWMKDTQTFKLEFVDSKNERVVDAISLSQKDFVLRRLTAMVWANGQPAKGDNGANTGNYETVDIVSGGDYAGPDDDVYLVEAVVGGALDGTAQVIVTSVQGDSNPAELVPGENRGDPPQNAIPVISDQAIDLGTAGYGATITFTDRGETSELVAGDRWIVKVVTPSDTEKPPEGPPEPTVELVQEGTSAIFGAMAEIRLQVAKSGAPVVTLPTQAKTLRITWSAKPNAPYELPITFASSDSLVGCYGPDDKTPTQSCQYGFDMNIVVDPPDSGTFHKPGQTITGRIELVDGAGNRLHAADQLPTYREFLAGASQGILYFTSGPIPGGAGFFSESQANMTEVHLVGPKHLIETNYGASTPVRFIDLNYRYPSMSVVMGGRGNPALWEQPISTNFEFELPSNAESGTYVLMGKAQRSFFGETIYRMPTVDIQVASVDSTKYRTSVGNCDMCHLGDAIHTRLRHGTPESATCMACHGSRSGFGAELIHTIHYLSPEYRAERNDCSLCHLAEDSHTRASEAMCGSCHQEVHPGEQGQEGFTFPDDQYQSCAPTCHRDSTSGHIPPRPR